MAASIYATPPPDLSSEDTALSDVSNSSTLNTNRGGGSSSNNSSSNTNNNSNSHNTLQPHEATTEATTATSTAATTTTGAATTSSMSPNRESSNLESKSKSPLGSNTNEAADGDEAADAEAEADAEGEVEAGAETEGDMDPTAMAAMAAAAANAAAMQLQLLEALNDAAKKRRKQHNPSRLEALNLSGGAEGDEVGVAAGAEESEPNAVIDYEEKLSKMLLPKSIEKLKETFELLQQQKLQPEDISEAQEKQQQQREREREREQQQQMMNPYQTYCKQCGENFETEFKLSLHMLQDHQQQQQQQQQLPSRQQLLPGDEPMDLLSSIKVKLERADSPSQLELQQQHEQQQQQQQQQQMELSNGHANSNKEHELWLQAMAQQQQQHQQQQQQQAPLGGMPPGFGFPPEAAALGWPLLGMPGFTGVEGLNRPPLRIFNPEAYCELCNKEFCNKYFLKTHKANKHGIFDPAGDLTTPNNNNNNNGSSNSSSNNLNNLSLNNNSCSSNNNNNNNSTSSNNNSNAPSMFQQLQLPREAPPQKPEPQLTPPAPPTVHCDICSKRFTNVFAMRRHRAKQHEQTTPTSSRRGSPSEQQPPPTQQVPQQQQQQQQHVKQEPSADALPYQLPEGFREDFTLEQEEVAFAPPPRKLPPQLQQQARESNCSPDKLRRLGVLLPEAFCELCCKEYANRYFLRTHKWKRHGVFVPPDELVKEEQQPLMSAAANWPFMPLNLMLAKAAAEQEQQQQQQQQQPEAEQHSEEEQLLEEQQPNKRIKLEPLDEPNAAEKADSSVMGLQNLQKLQSMLQQLNDFNGKRPLPCHLCGRELEHQYALRAHLMTEHASQLLPEGHPMLYQQQQQQQLPLKLSPLGAGAGSPTTVATPTPTANELRCQACEREFATTQEFKQHIAEVHLGRIPSGSPLREGFYTPERATMPGAGAGVGGGAAGAAPPAPAGPPRAAYTITPTSSYCEICNKELCNKYFMKTHMQRMHGIEIENGAQIGGVVCNICNKELCSKYFLRVHKHNTHGIIEDGAPLPQPRGQSSAQNGVKAEAQQQQQQQQQQLLEPEIKLTTPLASDASSSALNEQCPLCARQFRSAKWLRTHLMNEHGAAGLEKLREVEQPTAVVASSSSKPNSPTLKIPNGNAASVNPTANNLAQALQNAQQQLFGQMQLPKGMPLPLPLPGMFEQTPRFKEYQCSLCPFTTPYYAFLFIHERSHALLNGAGGAGELGGEASLGVEAEPPRDRSYALAQGKARSKSHRDRSDRAERAERVEAMEHMEPTNLTTTSNSSSTHSNSSSHSNHMKPQTRTPTPTALPSPGTAQATAAAIMNTSSTSPRARSPTPARRGSNNNNNNTSQPGTPNGIGAHRSAATSPFEMCSDLANGSGKPASYAQPDKAEEAYQMQAFHLAPADADAEGLFAPALVYLPVRVRTSESATLSFRLTPA